MVAAGGAGGDAFPEPCGLVFEGVFVDLFPIGVHQREAEPVDFLPGSAADDAVRVEDERSRGAGVERAGIAGAEDDASVPAAPAFRFPDPVLDGPTMVAIQKRPFVRPVPMRVQDGDTREPVVFAVRVGVSRERVRSVDQLTDRLDGLDDFEDPLDERGLKLPCLVDGFGEDVV